MRRQRPSTVRSSAFLRSVLMVWTAPRSPASMCHNVVGAEIRRHWFARDLHDQGSSPLLTGREAKELFHTANYCRDAGGNFLIE